MEKLKRNKKRAEKLRQQASAARPEQPANASAQQTADAPPAQFTRPPRVRRLSVGRASVQQAPSVPAQEPAVPEKPAPAAKPAPQEKPAPAAPQAPAPRETPPPPAAPEKPRAARSPKLVLKPAARTRARSKPRPQKRTGPPSVIELKIRDIRKKRSMRKWRGIVLVLAVCAGILAWATGLYGASLGLLSDIGEGIQIALDQSGSYPVRTGISNPVQARALTGGFILVGKQDVAVFSASGVKLRTLQLGYGRPAVTVGGNRFCVYSRAGTEYRIESRTKNLSVRTTEQPILFCEMSRNGNLAIVTRSERYSAELAVYSRDQLPVYRWSITEADGTPIRAAFAADGKRLAVGNLLAKDGKLCTVVNMLDTRSTEVGATYRAEGSVLLHLEWIAIDRVLAVFDNMAVLLEASNGQELARYSYEGKTLQDYSCANGLALLLDSPLGSRLVLLDHQLEQLQDCMVESAVQVTYTGGVAYLIREDNVTGINTEGETVLDRAFESVPREVIAVGRPLVIVDGQADLLATEGSLAYTSE